MKPYTELEPLRDVVLEASWIRSVIASPGRLLVMLEAVIAKDSPRLEQPRPGEQHFWLPGVLQFDGVTELRWTGQPVSPNQDADGSTDYGNLDQLSFDRDHFHLESEAGVIDVVASGITLDLGER